MRSFVLWLFDRAVDLELWSERRSRAFKAMLARRALARKIAQDGVALRR